MTTPNVAAPALVRGSEAARNHLRCIVCGTPWHLHDGACSRHAYRYLDACRGVVASGLWSCCDSAAVVSPAAKLACPVECPCHLPPWAWVEEKPPAPPPKVTPPAPAARVCRGVASGSEWACCWQPGMKTTGVAAACPHGCPCHLPDPLDKGLRT